MVVKSATVTALSSAAEMNAWTTSPTAIDSETAAETDAVEANAAPASTGATHVSPAPRVFWMVQWPTCVTVWLKVIVGLVSADDAASFQNAAMLTEPMPLPELVEPPLNSPTLAQPGVAVDARQVAIADDL